MAIGFPLRKYIEYDQFEVPDCDGSDVEQIPVKRNHTYRMLGHLLRVTTVKETLLFYDGIPERRVFLTCDDDCNCGPTFNCPVKLQILERHLEKVCLDKF